MDLGGTATSAWQHEAADGLDGLGEPVGVLLETADMPLEDPVRRSRTWSWRSELALGDEHLVLEPEEERGGLVLIRELLGGSPEMGPELVVGADGADPSGVLPYAAAAQEAGLSAVAGTGV